MKLVRIGLLCAAIILLFASNSSAVPTLGGITGNTSLNGITDSGLDYVTLPSSFISITVTLLFENADMASTNEFGIYDYTHTSRKLEIFDGDNVVGDSKVVNFDLESGKAWVNSNKKVSIGEDFGFYLDSKVGNNGGGIFYSNESENSNSDDGVRHLLLYNTRGLTGLFSGNPDTVVAGEDLRINASGYDADFDDMVIGVTNVYVGAAIPSVPEPATIGILGLGAVMLLTKRGKK